MATTTNYVALPPDGVGKKLRHRLLTDLVVTISNDVPISNTVYAASGAYGTVVGKYNAPDGSISWYVNVQNGTFAVNDVLTDGASGTGTSRATVVTSTPSVYEPQVSISDAKTPEYTATVDKRGALLTSFPEGTPQFDSFGHMQVSQMLAVGEYYHFTSDLAGKYATTATGSSSSVVFNPITSGVVFTTGLGATDVARRTTNQYHPYKLGTSQLALMSIIVGDTGKASVVREWGYFDDYNGFGFRLDGTTFKVFYRSDAGGFPVDTEITQSNWNINTLNSSTTSDFQIDVSKANLYWMDVQGLVGRIRLGVETPDGRRITCHEFRNINAVSNPTMRNLSLPLTFQQRNTGVPSSSPSTTQSMRMGAASVFTESADVKYTGVLTHIIPDDPVILTDYTSYKPFLSFKPKTTIDGPSVGVTSLANGVSYTIDSIGTTNFQLIGAAQNIVGTKFTANNAGTGTGTAHMNIPNSVIGIHETFDWACQGNTNIHVGIFVLPSESWSNNVVWSTTIDPDTMLYVDQQTTDIPQYKYWAPAANTVSGNIAGNILTVTSIGNFPGAGVFKETFLTPPPVTQGQYATDGTQWKGTLAQGLSTPTGTILPRTKILKQLTANTQGGANTFTTTYGTQTTVNGLATGTTGSNRVVLVDTSGVAIGQLVTVSNGSLPQGTFVENVTGTTVTVSTPFIASGSGATYGFNTPGGLGTYSLSVGSNTAVTQTVASFSGYGAYYAFKPIESFLAPAGSSGRAALGDRIEKSFGLGGNPNPPEDAKGVFVFAAKPMAANAAATLMYTKYWKEIR